MRGVQERGRDEENVRALENGKKGNGYMKNSNSGIVCFTYSELFHNLLKRVLLLAGKLAGYKGFAVLLATVLLFCGHVGEAVWASVVVSALCGAVLPKAFGAASVFEADFYTGESKNEKYSCNAKKFGRAAGSRRGVAVSRGDILRRGKERIREAFRNSGDSAGADTGKRETHGGD